MQAPVCRRAPSVRLGCARCTCQLGRADEQFLQAQCSDAAVSGNSSTYLTTCWQSRKFEVRQSAHQRPKIHLKPTSRSLFPWVVAMAAMGLVPVPAPKSRSGSFRFPQQSALVRSSSLEAHSRLAPECTAKTDGKPQGPDLSSSLLDAEKSFAGLVSGTWAGTGICDLRASVTAQQKQELLLCAQW